MDLERLDEALEWYEEDAGQVLPGSTAHERIVDAARAYRDLANGERVEWCEVHKSPTFYRFPGDPDHRLVRYRGSLMGDTPLKGHTPSEDGVHGWEKSARA